MKKKLTMKMKMFFLSSLCSLFSVLFYLSCEQPFKAGLGPIIDLQDPTIVLERPVAGAYIRGITEFSGRAGDDSKLDSVWFHISNYPDFKLNEFQTTQVNGLLYHRISDTEGDSRKINWKFKIDTKQLNDDGERVFPDGDFKIRLRVTDAVGKFAITDEIVFYIKNDIPEIAVDAPPILQGTGEGLLGGLELNYGTTTALSASFKRVMDTKSMLVGRISDDEGIYRGEPNPAYHVIDEDGNPKFDAQGNPEIVELFPPQIRFWQVYFDTYPVDKEGVEVAKAYRAGTVPTLEQEPWQELGKDGVGEVMETGVNNLTFLYTLPDASGSYFAFQVRAQSIDLVHSKAEYPKDYINFAGATEDDKKYNSFVLILVREPLEYPALELYRFEDIYGVPSKGKPTRVDGMMQYNDLPSPVEPDKTDGNHVYVNTPIVNKGGPFTLRMKASHSGGIASATVYWEKSDKSEKGRFIWDPIEFIGDPIENKPYPSWIGTIPSMAGHYSKWGLNEPDGATSVRSFVFTYTDLNPLNATDATATHDRLPAAADTVSKIGGMSKIQKYTGQARNKDGILFELDELPEDITNWQNVYKLDEGTYNISVYATSNSGTRIATPFVVTVSIDRQKPEIELNFIEGSAGEREVTTDGNKRERENTVNGVIRPRFILSDSRPTDTGFRTGSTDFFKRPTDQGGGYYQEQAYILIKNDQKSVMDAYLATKPWPEFKDINNNTPVFPVIPNNVKVWKSGPIINSSCLFRTSYIYNDKSDDITNGGDSLENGDYRLYAFARDNAFNTAWISYPIKVLRSSDFPTFDFSVGSIYTTSVTQPDSSFDWSSTSPDNNKSFIINNNARRNVFTPNSSIRVRIKDDDGLDLGQNAAVGSPAVAAQNSGIEVTITGATVNNVAGKWTTEAWTDAKYKLTLSDADIKKAFPPPGMGEDGNRIAVKEITGTISQEMLVNSLRASNDYEYLFKGVDEATAILPDGIYRIGISIRDYQPAKLKMVSPFQIPGDTKDADVIVINEMPVPPLDAEPVLTTEYFWIAVDSKNPEIKPDEDTSGGIILPGTPQDLKGKVFDENGPITLKDWWVQNGSIRESAMGSDVAAGTPKIIVTDLTFNGYTNGKWEYDFAYKLDMNDRQTGAFDFVIKFEDRFGNTSTLTKRYAVDSEPPNVSLIKKIETFKRNYDDVKIEASWPKKAADYINRERLAVKVVNFSINATDNNGVRGVRWWLLPEKTGANNTGFDNTGKLTSSKTIGGGSKDTEGYDAFPATQLQVDGPGGTKVDKPGVYYGYTSNAINGFTKGAYGVVDVENKQFTIAIDSQRLQDPNGEYSLFIIAEDRAGLHSSYTDATILDAPKNLFQEVFFLQEEDKPYFSTEDSPISPGESWANDVFEWPKKNGKEIEMPVLGGLPIIRGTIWENNGFLKADSELSWPGSITIWFSGSAAKLPDGTGGPDNHWETLVQNGSDIPGYTKKTIPADYPLGGLGKQGRNISLTIPLTELFPDEFNSDGRKRYIIKATDSPVNKLWYDSTATSVKQTTPSVPGTPMGLGTAAGLTTSDQDEGVRVSRWKQYAFVYDAIPPKVVIDTPLDKPDVKTYGEESFGSTFILGGSISDANLAQIGTSPNEKYYFDYNLNSEARGRFTLELMQNVAYRTNVAEGAAAPTPPTSTVPGKHIYAIDTDVNGKVTVYFRIDPKDVTGTNGIIPVTKFTSLPEGQHMLTLWAADKSGKEGAAWVNFIKDVEAPTIAFSNLDEKPYDTTNKSKVENWWINNNRQTLLFGNNTLPLTTIYYESGVPELRGTITDIVSNISIKTNTNANVGAGAVNDGSSSFKYWIDNENTPRYLALIDGAGTKSVRWTILLTNNGQRIGGTPLCDGVHTIRLTAADTADMKMPDPPTLTIAFRIDSQAPKSTAGVAGAMAGVYGNVAYQNPTMFTVSLGAKDANLDRVELSIWKKDAAAAAVSGIFRPWSTPTTPAGTTGTWAYAPFGSTAPAVPAIPDELQSVLSKPTGNLSEDYILFIGSFPVTTSLFTGVDSGNYDVKVVAYDTIGNKSEEFVWSFTYDKDAPVIEFTNPDDKTQQANATRQPQDFIDVADLSAQNDINRLVSQNLRIQGNVKDTFSGIVWVQSRVERWDWLNTGWVQVEDWRDVYKNTANTQTQIAWTKNLLGQNKTAIPPPAQADEDLDLRTTANPSGEGLYRIRIRAKDASSTQNGLNKYYNSNDWVYPPNPWAPTPIPDIGNPVISNYVYFYYDRTNPTLEISSINGSTTSMDTYYSKPANGFTFKGRVTDNNRFAKVTVKFESGTNNPDPKPATLTALVSGDPGFTNANDNPARTINRGGVTQNWEAAFTDAASYPDGKYKVTVTVYDMTGRSSSETKSFILDSTPPTVRFTLPAKDTTKPQVDGRDNMFGIDSESPKFASVLVAGGPTAAITGTTDDKPGLNGESGSQSGIDQMWFHLGFIDGSNDFPTKAAIQAWENTMIERHTNLSAQTVAALSAKQKNPYMDTIAEYRASPDSDNKGNAWFKLGGGHKPTGFVIDNPNIYDWRFEIPSKIDKMPSNSVNPSAEYDNYLDYTASGISLNADIGGLKLYCNEITIKGRRYYVNPTGTNPVRQMVRAVPGQPGGVYRLPLWVRLTDTAGNVEYYCHDIWIDANGDIPSTSIDSPSNGTEYNARGGTVSVDGTARSNTSVYDVIFRVFADNVRSTNLDGIQTNVNGTMQPNPANKTTGATNVITNRPNTAANPTRLIRINGYETAPTATVNHLPAEYRAGGSYGSSWQRANLTKPGGTGEQTVPWSIMLSQEGGWDAVIKSNGFASGGTTNNMVRIWLEVFVLDGTVSAKNCSIYADDKLGTASWNNPAAPANGGLLYGTAPPSVTPGPRPYVKAFYVSTGAAEITDAQVGTWNNGTSTTNRHGNFDWKEYRGAGQETRSNRFAFSATLRPNPNNNQTSGLGEVAYRVKLDDGSYGTWETVWKSGNPNNPAITTNTPYNNGKGVTISVRDGSGTPGARYYFDYAIDSKNAGDNAAFAEVPGKGNGWQYTGGTMTVQIRMKDNSAQPNEAEQTIQVGVDNFIPLADTVYRTNPKVAGTNVNFQGRVYDYAKPTAGAAIPDSMNTEYTPRKLARVSVWFTKGTGNNLRYVNMNVKNTTVAAANLPSTRTISVSPVNSRTSNISGGGADDLVNNITVTNRGGTAASTTYPGLGSQQEYNADYVRDITQATGGNPQNKMLWAPVASANYDVRWSITLDSTILPDGDMTLHYIVVDEAGNASYYTQPGISVRNNYPEISNVTLYTYNVGIGAAYTAPAEVSYSLNDYRGTMFANYTDTDDNRFFTNYGAGAADTNQNNPGANSRRKSDTTGYLNSGFISKNSYIGFKVETLRDTGNTPLTFRLQHVTRERVVLTRANLQKLIANIGTANNINLYTIAWRGNMVASKWQELGVRVDRDPTLGTHFVLSTAPDFKIADFEDSTAEVWRYVRQAGIANDVAGTASNGAFVVGPDNFKFDGAAAFTNIQEYNGSHPDSDDTVKDNPTSTTPIVGNDPAAGTANATPLSTTGTAFFLIRVWDSVSTAAGATADDQLNDALVVGMNVYKTDTGRPVARLYDLNPYTETAVREGNLNQTIKDAAYPNAIGSNIVRGGLYNAGTSRAMVRSGFIDPRNATKALDPVNSGGVALPSYDLKVSGDLATTGNTTDKVSGKVILRGYAWDDQLIDEIQVNADGTNRVILKLDTTGTAATNTTYGKMKAQTGYENSAFVVEDLHWKTGHTVEWAYVWDTGNAPVPTRPIQVTVKDYKNTTTGTSTSVPIASETGTTFHNLINVEIVPYITGFERKTPDFTTKRSLQGWYSFYQGETGVKVNGYNFGTGASTVSLPNAANLTATGTGNAAATQRTFDVPTAATSGAITATFSGTAAYNNGSSTTGKSWNKEANSFTPGSDLWINKPYAHIWRSAQEVGTGTPGATGGTAGTIFGANEDSAGLDSPGMSLQYTGNGAGRLHGSWTVYGRESLFYAQNTGVKPTVTNNVATTNSTQGEGTFGRPGALLLSKAGEPYSDGDIDYYNGAGGDNYTNNTSVVAAFQRDGEPWLILKPRLSSIVFNNAGATDGGGHDYGYYISRQNGPVSTYRWKNARIKKADVSTGDANPGKVFVTAYDSTYKRLFFKTVTGSLSPNNSGNQITNDANGGTTLYLDGGTTGNGPTTGIGGTAAVALGQGAGNWSAVDYDSTGRPVVAYFDEEHQTLRIAYGNSTGSPAASDWTRRYVLPESSPLYRGSGSYVSMEIDRANSNRVHLAFYNSTYKAVVYATGTISATAFTLTSASVIDRVVEGGQWTDISVDKDGNPWIVYADSARLGNRDGARIAYKGAFTRALTDTITNTTITGWEALTMPANYQVSNDRLNIAVWPPTGYTGSATTSPIGGWNAAVGYASDQFRIGYFYKPAVPTGF